MSTAIKRAILRVLLACDGLPMPESALLSAVRIMGRPVRPTDGDVLEALREVEAAGYVSGATDELTAERSWTLTVKGQHRARTA